ncbi:unnamed protein product [Gongylonema pulchrum]|uniref:PLAT domain-containing protein n=1 Tax=Gongylonema pulchrum TaxID=637853 RepID=A0A183CXK7_9BILA|nr:unnamed protein product [Gongylonema pulchrum]
MECERVGVTVKSEERWIIVSIIATIEGQDTFEIKIELDARSAAPKLGTWLALLPTGDGSYKIERRCREPLFPTRIYKDNVMLVTLIYFQAKGEEGYGDWVWAPKLGRVAAVCHENYESNRAYLALVARTAAKYRACIEYNWMLTKYIEMPGSEHVFENIGRSSYESISDSDSLLEALSSDSSSFAQTLTSKVIVEGDLKAEHNLITEPIIVPLSTDATLENIEIFRGVVALLNNNLVVVQPMGRIGFLKNNRSKM